MIRLFHRVWVGGEPPADLDAYGQSWVDLNPGWTMVTWRDDDLRWLANRDLYNRADELTPPWYVTRMRANLARYEILAEHGGVYVDFDFEALAPVEPHLPDRAWAVEERPGVLANGICGALRPGDPFWRLMVSGLPDRIEAFRGRPSNESCGPWYLTAQAEAAPDEIVRLPTRMFYPYHYRDLIDGAPPDFDRDGVVAHHLWAGRPEVRR